MGHLGPCAALLLASGGICGSGAFAPASTGIGSGGSAFLHGKVTSPAKRSGGRLFAEPAEAIPEGPSSATAADVEVVEESAAAPLVPAPPAAKKLNPHPPPLPPKTPSPPQPPKFDPSDPEALIAIAKSFLASDFGLSVPDSASPASASTASGEDPLFSFNFVWISGNHVNDGRTGLLTREEYLAAGRYFDVRGSFPDWDYGAHDFRVMYDEGDECVSSDASKEIHMLGDDASGEDGEGGEDGGKAAEKQGGEATVRFTTRVTGTFGGAPLKLRTMLLGPNGRVMRCPPTSASITYGTHGEERGQITKLVTDMVLDRAVGNTNGLSGVPAAAYVAGAPSNAWVDILGGTVPPLVALGRLVTKPAKRIDANGIEEGRLAPFPTEVMMQLAEGVIGSDFGLDDPTLLGENFVYVEPLLGPLDKERYLEVFAEYDVRGAVPDLDYGLQNFRLDPFDPYRVWVDTRAKGTRTGSVGRFALPSDISSATYNASPESLSFTFDDDGFCIRLTAAAVLDPLLGNTGGLGGVYGLLYATGTPMNALKTRSLQGFLGRATKSLLSKANIGVGADGWQLSDGRQVKRMLPERSSSIISLPTTARLKSLTKPTAITAAPSKPFFAAMDEASPEQKPQRPTIALPKAFTNADVVEKTKKVTPPEPKTPPTAATTIRIERNAEETSVSVPRSTNQAPPSRSKTLELRKAAAAARAEAAEAKKRASAMKAAELEAKQAALEAARKKKEEQMAAAAKKAREEEEKRAAALEAAQKRKEEQMAAAAKKARDEEEKRIAAAQAAQKRKEEQLAAAAKKAKDEEEKRAAVAEAARKREEEQLEASAVTYKEALDATGKKEAKSSAAGSSSVISPFFVELAAEPKATSEVVENGGEMSPFFAEGAAEFKEASASAGGTAESDGVMSPFFAEGATKPKAASESAGEDTAERSGEMSPFFAENAEAASSKKPQPFFLE